MCPFHQSLSPKTPSLQHLPFLHSSWISQVLVFHDQGLLLPFLEQQLGTPRPAQSPPRRLQPQPPKQPPPKHLLEAAKAEDEVTGIEVGGCLKYGCWMMNLFSLFADLY